MQITCSGCGKNYRLVAGNLKKNMELDKDEQLKAIQKRLNSFFTDLDRCKKDCGCEKCDFEVDSIGFID